MGRDPPASTPHRFPTGFVVALFVAGTVLAVAVGAWGATGHLGAGIAGSRPPASGATPPLSKCQGAGQLGHFYFILVADAAGQFSFNASSPGPCFAVAAGSHVTIHFEIARGTNHTDSFDLINGTGPIDQMPVFPGAGTANGSRLIGMYPGTVVNYTFLASTAGAYRYVSEVGDHAAVGMWGPFNVTAAPLALGPTTTGSAAPTAPAGGATALATARRTMEAAP